MKVSTNLLKDILLHYETELKPLFGARESRSLLMILCEHFFQVDRLNLSLKPDFRLSESEMLQLHFAVKKLKQHKPVQYITGKAWFNDLPYKVNESVLIPRPETEEMMLLAIDSMRQKTGQPSILDLGTGSGCIAIALKKALPNARVEAIDISTEALELAKENAAYLGAEVVFHKLSMIDAKFFFSHKKFDLLISNPPYVTVDDSMRMKENVLKWEPETALFAPADDPLFYYRQIAGLARGLLKPGGILWLEINEKYGHATATLFESAAFTKVKVLEDMHGKARFITAEKT